MDIQLSVKGNKKKNILQHDLSLNDVFISNINTDTPF